MSQASGGGGAAEPEEQHKLAEEAERPNPKNRLLSRPQTDQVIADEDVFEITTVRDDRDDRDDRDRSSNVQFEFA